MCSLEVFHPSSLRIPTSAPCSPVAFKTAFSSCKRLFSDLDEWSWDERAESCDERSESRKGLG